MPEEDSRTESASTEWSHRHDGGWRRRATRYLFESAWFKLRQDELTLPGGDEITYSFVEKPGWALVLPLLPDGRVVMERIYRHTLQRTMLECPAGGCDGDPPEAAARRELEEETGYLANQMIHLGRFAPSSGSSSEEFDIFIAIAPEPGGRIQLENTEQLEVELIAFSELLESARRGEIGHAPSALAILLTADRLRGL